MKKRLELFWGKLSEEITKVKLSINLHRHHR
jgi:hypothetical protein